MTALPAVPNVVRVALEGEVDSQPWAGVQHWQFNTVSGPLTNTNCNRIAANFTAQWAAHIASKTATAVTLVRVGVVDLSSSTSGVGEDTTGSLGEVPSATVSPAAAVLNHKTIGRRYRGGHPRTYWTGVTSDQTVGNSGRTLIGTDVTDWEDVTNAFYAGVTSNVVSDGTTNCLFFAECCVHYFLDHALLPVPTVDLITARGIEPNLATQRRRLRRTAV